MEDKPNAQYNVAAPNSLAERIGGRVRRQMFELFMERFRPTEYDRVLDIGATSDQSYSISNYFEAMYPFPAKITASGIDNASFLEKLYPGLSFVQANALDLPFDNAAFEFVHSSAVIEHVGSFDRQKIMIKECIRVARRGIFLTTPNRWFPIEFHTQLPLVHWLPAPLSRATFEKLGYGFFAKEENLNLLSRSKLHKAVEDISGWTFEIAGSQLLRLTSNLLLIGRRDH